MESSVLWKTVLAELQLTLTPGSYQTLFSKSSLTGLDNNIAVISLANAQIKNMVETRYYALLKEIVDRLTKNNCALVFNVAKEKAPEQEPSLGPLFTEEKDQKDEQERLVQATMALGLNKNYTFDNFAVSGSNQLAYAAASAVTKSPGRAYNPLYLWGGVGVGKTHLAQAIAHVLLQKNPATKIVYCSSEEFTNEITMAIRNKGTDRFKTKFRTASALLVDDIQFIAGKDTTQEEFFHTFNAVQKEGGQVILTSDKPPSAIAGLEDRIRSRFEGGLVADIQPPDLELRTAILMIKAKQREITLGVGLAQKIAAQLTEARKIEGFVARLVSEINEAKRPLNEELVGSILGLRMAAETDPGPPPKQIVSEVCSFYGIKASDLRGQRRKREIVRPRQVLMWLLRNQAGLTLEEVGRLLGGRDHTTIIHGVEAIDGLLKTSTNTQEEVLKIKQRLLG